MKTQEQQVEELEKGFTYGMRIRSKANIEGELNKLKQKAKLLKAEIEKEYRSLKRQHCDVCEKNYECPTCKPEFDKIRNLIQRLNKIIGEEDVKK